jgi:hypothetical protein
VKSRVKHTVRSIPVGYQAYELLVGEIGKYLMKKYEKIVSETDQVVGINR